MSLFDIYSNHICMYIQEFLLLFSGNQNEIINKYNEKLHTRLEKIH